MTLITQDITFRLIIFLNLSVCISHFDFVSFICTVHFKNTVNPLINAQGVDLNSSIWRGRLLEGALIRRGRLFKNLISENIYIIWGHPVCTNTEKNLTINEAGF